MKLPLVIFTVLLSGALNAAQDWAWNSQAGYTGQVDLGSSGSVSSLSTLVSGSANLAGNAAVQPPLVVNVQAGSSGSGPMCVPKINSGTTRPAIPVCTAGYTAVWSDQSASTVGGWYIDTCTTASGDYATYNIGGSGINFISTYDSSSGVAYRGFSISSAMSFIGGSPSYENSAQRILCSSSTYTQAWSATLCCK